MPFSAKQVADLESNSAANFSQIISSADITPEAGIEDQGVVAEILKHDARCRFGVCLGLFGVGLQNLFSDFMVGRPLSSVFASF